MSSVPSLSVLLYSACFLLGSAAAAAEEVCDSNICYVNPSLDDSATLIVGRDAAEARCKEAFGDAWGLACIGSEEQNDLAKRAALAGGLGKEERGVWLGHTTPKWDQPQERVGIPEKSKCIRPPEISGSLQGFVYVSTDNEFYPFEISTAEESLAPGGEWGEAFYCVTMDPATGLWAYTSCEEEGYRPLCSGPNWQEGGDDGSGKDDDEMHFLLDPCEKGRGECKNGARCESDESNPGDFVCLCTTNWTGDRCDEELLEDNDDVGIARHEDLQKDAEDGGAGDDSSSFSSSSSSNIIYGAVGGVVGVALVAAVAVKAKKRGMESAPPYTDMA